MEELTRQANGVLYSADHHCDQEQDRWQKMDCGVSRGKYCWLIHLNFGTIGSTMESKGSANLIYSDLNGVTHSSHFSQWHSNLPIKSEGKEHESHWFNLIYEGTLLSQLLLSSAAASNYHIDRIQDKSSHSRWSVLFGTLSRYRIFFCLDILSFSPCPFTPIFPHLPSITAAYL